MDHPAGRAERMPADALSTPALPPFLYKKPGTATEVGEVGV